MELRVLGLQLLPWELSQSLGSLLRTVQQMDVSKASSPELSKWAWRGQSTFCGSLFSKKQSWEPQEGVAMAG